VDELDGANALQGQGLLSHGILRGFAALRRMIKAFLWDRLTLVLLAS
jgi:hypothetical protein